MELTRNAESIFYRIQSVRKHARTPSRVARDGSQRWPTGPRWLTRTTRYRKLLSRLKREMDAHYRRPSGLRSGTRVKIRRPSHNGLVGVVCRLPDDRMTVKGGTAVKVITEGVNKGEVLQLQPMEFHTIRRLNRRTAPPPDQSKFRRATKIKVVSR